MRVEAVVEVPKGSRNKYEMNHETGNIERLREWARVADLILMKVWRPFLS